MQQAAATTFGRPVGERKHVMHLLLNLSIGGAETLVYEWVQRLDRER